MARLVGGRYAIERRIGEGGMAEVLLARDEARGGAPVVVKRSRAHLAHQPEFAQLFLREARLASLIHHPNVVELEGVGEDNGQPYLVMEYLQGFTIREIYLRSARSGGVPQDLAALVILGAARGLHAAHIALDERGVPMGLMHRDVSPHNLFITEAGAVKVLDFGIAKGVNEHTMTRAGHVKGKASYLAPEQLDPNARMDARADLFSLGIVAWELFTGKRLFRRTTELDTINAIRALQVERPNQVRPEIDAEYADIVMSMLARKPDHRPATADAIADSLKRALARRAPQVTARSLADFVAHIREIDPKDVPRSSLAPGVPKQIEPRRAARKLTPVARQEARPVEAPKPRPPQERGPEEMTADVAPPAAASWVNLGGGTAPVDGSVVGTFAVAGATVANADLSGGYEGLSADDFELEPSHAGPLPRAPLDSDFDPDGDAPTLAVAPAVVPPTPMRIAPPMSGPASIPPGVPPPRVAPMSPFHQETQRIRPRSKLDLLAKRTELGARELVDRFETRFGARPDPRLIAALLVGALVSGAVLAFLIFSLLD